MNKVLITNDTLTVTRIEAIAHRTQSAFLSGAKAMMIQGLKRQMINGVAHFIYQKKNGEMREAWGTTCGTLAEKHTNGCSVGREHFGTTAYFDIERGAWRSFKWENIVAIY